MIVTSLTCFSSSFLLNNHQIIELSFFSITIFLGFIGASSICSCLGCFAFAKASFSSFSFSIISSSSCFFFSSLSSFFDLETFLFSFGLNQSQTKVSLISLSFSGISKAFLAKFTGENLKSITREVKNIIKKASKVAILQSKLSRSGYRLKAA